MILNYWLFIALALAAAYLVVAWRGRTMSKLKIFEPLASGRKPTVALELATGGTITLELYPEAAPQHVASFLDLIGKGYYDGLVFHRVVPGFVVQGGCPEGTGMGGPGYKLKAEFNERPHLTGTLAMARSSDPDSAGSQFYICLAPQPGLDREYTVFGQVTEGMDLVQKIQKGDEIRKMSVQS
jgi:peptidylprolyl isomerase/peptidyl-prolyl cis-trans isomerase B (cyclophilin B)